MLLTDISAILKNDPGVLAQSGRPAEKDPCSHFLHAGLKLRNVSMACGKFKALTTDNCMFLCGVTDLADSKAYMKLGFVSQEDVKNSKSVTIEEAKDNNGTGTTAQIFKYSTMIQTYYDPVHEPGKISYFIGCSYDQVNNIDQVYVGTVNRRDANNLNFQELGFAFGGSGDGKRIYDVKCKHQGGQEFRAIWKQYNAKIGLPLRDYCDVYLGTVTININVDPPVFVKNQVAEKLNKNT